MRSINVLKIVNLEKQDGHLLVFPAFSLGISENDIVAIHASTNVRIALLHILMGKLAITDGEIWINNERVKEFKRNYYTQVAFFCLQDSMYDRLSVKDYLTFYKNLYDSNVSIVDGIQLLQLEGKEHRSLTKLTHSEQRRVAFGRLLFQDPNLFVFEEPDQNIDLETKRIFLKMVTELKRQGKAILILTSNIESALSVSNQVFRLDESGLHPLDILPEDESSLAVEEKEAGQNGEQPPQEEIVIQPVRFEKIPTKVNDKIVLFDPPEVDYIESNDGQSNIYIKGEMYPSVFTMTELEKRLHPYGFFRCHRSYIVNLQKVREVITWTRNSFTLVLTDERKSSIPLSKSKMAELKEMLGLK